LSHERKGVFNHTRPLRGASNRGLSRTGRPGRCRAIPRL